MEERRCPICFTGILKGPAIHDEYVVCANRHEVLYTKTLSNLEYMDKVKQIFAQVVTDIENPPVPKPKETRLLSHRGIPLVCQSVSNRPIITVENYIKWYNFFIIMPTGEVVVSDWEIINSIDLETPRETLVGDHIFKPVLLQKYADRISGYVDDVSMEVVIGRWIREYKNQDIETI